MEGQMYTSHAEQYDMTDTSRIAVIHAFIGNNVRIIC